MHRSLTARDYETRPKHERPKTHPLRRCRRCGHTLSRYNGSVECWSHGVTFDEQLRRLRR